MDIDTEPLFPQIAQNSDEKLVVAAKSSEIVIAFVGAVGVNLNHAEEAAKTKLKEIGYRVIRITVAMMWTCELGKPSVMGRRTCCVPSQLVWLVAREQGVGSWRCWDAWVLGASF
jgi:hypothetical protein